MKPFDEEFADKVRAVFDRHDESFDPSAWDAMNERLKQRRRGRIIAMLYVASRVAASLLIISVLSWLSYTYLFTLTPSVSDSNIAEEVIAGSDIRQRHESAAATDALSHLYAPEDSPLAAETSQQPLRERGTGKEPADQKTELITYDRDIGAAIAGRETKQETHDRETGLALTDREAGQVLPLAAEAVAEGRAGDTLTKDTPRDADIQQELLPQGEQRTLPDLRLAGKELADIALPSHEKQREKPLSWGVAAGSMMTYAEQQLAGGLGFSAGVTSAYRVTDRVSIASGLLLAYQQFEVASAPLVTMSAGKEYARTDMASVRTTADHSYEMLALDIPLNLQIRLPGAGNGRWYVSTGLSSLLYLQQELSGVETSYVETNYLDTSRNAIVYNSFTSSVAVSSSSGPFSHFDFARLLNLSAGYAIRQEKTTTIIEPFIKLPLGSISSRELKMGMVGVSLRLTFGH